MRHKQVYRLIAAATLVVGAAACGGDDDSAADEAPAADTASDEATASAEPTAAPAADVTAAPTTVSDAGAGSGSLADALAADILSEDEADGGPVATPEDAQCWADAIVSGIGEDRLTELGMTPADVGDIEDYAFDPDEVDVIVESLFGCTDVKAAFAEEFSGDFGAETAQCLADALDDDLLKDVFRVTIADPEAPPTPEFLEQFTAAAAGCGIDTSA